jgi:uncharacterized RDD family membrane protein YckC
VAATGYFALFWSTTGQTPGMRLLRLRVLGPHGAPPSVARSLLRVVALTLAIIPAFAGFLPVLFDSRRRGLHDMLARTVVVRRDATPPRPQGGLAAPARQVGWDGLGGG